MGSKLFVTLELRNSASSCPMIRQLDTRSFKHPVTLGAQSHILALNPYQRASFGINATTAVFHAVADLALV
jgi:hypothetical protein